MPDVTFVPNVTFHTGLVDKLDFAYRLLRKAHRQGARVIVCGDAQALTQLDEDLWVREVASFLPHVRLRVGEGAPEALARSPICLVEHGVEPAHKELLVNLGPAGVDDALQFGRVIELVGVDVDERAQGRARWRAYEAAGVAIVHHARSAGTP